jgi:DNA-binding transcriptional ArsR family regulator
MAPDLLSTIRREIDERLSELRPLLAERERLLGAVQALEEATAEVSSTFAPESVATKPAAPAKSTKRGGRLGGARRGSAAGAIERAASTPTEPATAERKASEPAAARDKPERAARGAAREAILAALDHGSHTVSELAVVTAMSGPNISGNLRKLVAEGAVVKTEREGKAAWALPDAV